jgi:gluconate 2-dehydrogenase alpha chain
MAAKVQEAIGAAMGVRVVAGARRVGTRYNTTDYQSSHVSGGAMMGASPDASVVNTWLQHWRLPNLWVAGASAFPQNSSANPTLTLMALAYRAADAIVTRYLKHPGPLV